MNLNKEKEKDFVDMQDMQAYENVRRINGVVESFDEYSSRVIPLQSNDEVIEFGNEDDTIYTNYIKQLTINELILAL